MTNILGSVSKLVFLIIAISASAGFFAGILEPKDFMLLAGMTFSYYFTTKSSPVDATGAK